ncbi:ACS family hexuronate transporter-like MFS transporter [Arcticibacter tournemirensis]|uniref:MFS transporter n=1 Tax=Arcticibacter tournemirensis TaxID=699437 RepID=A0A5M9HDA4_9SPHI|nr:MFS transporter [Arcticibacter tournemirensis]KAA8484720.1 MFS transporter [Arcticibacter tournemirensis]TQM46981.1 ACS family hexuronate transporter-like MFS transporter [Arcticibacter tournemirensis]
MKPSAVRWIILGLVFIATGLNFLDRQILSITIIKIQKEFKLSDVQYGMINTSFLVSYALMFTIGGRLTDRFGAKLGLAFSVGLWSIASGLHGFMNNFFQLILFRFLLGVGEGGCFPAAAKTVNELFERKERGLANGIAIGGSAMGAVLAPPLVIWISNDMGWRWSFIIPGVIGIVWFVVWVLIPWKKKVANTEIVAAEMKGKTVPFLKILGNRNAIVFLILRFLLDPVFYFIMFWIPKYLNEQRNVSFDEVGRLLWIPFLALGLSNMLGGYFSDKLIKRNFTVNTARKTVMGVAAFLTLGAMFIQGVSSVAWAIALMSLLMFAHGFWITNYITAISDVFGNNATSTVVGLTGTAGAIAGIIVNPLIGLVVQNFSYDPLWILCGLMYPLAFIILVVFIPQIKPLFQKEGEF